MIPQNSNDSYRNAFGIQNLHKNKMKTLGGMPGIKYEDMQRKLVLTREAMFMRTLDSLANLPLTQKRKMLINIPHDDHFYKHFENHFKASYIIPAITGIATINGISEHEITKTIQAYGITAYQNHPHLPLVGPDTPKSLIARAKMQAVGDKEIYQMRTILMPYPKSYKTKIKSNERITFTRIK